MYFFFSSSYIFLLNIHYIFWIVSITYSLIIYLFWHFGHFSIWICVSFCNIWTCLIDFNDYTMYYSFEGNQFFFYISLLCNHIHFVLFQKFIGSKPYNSLISFGLSKVLNLNYSFDGNTSFSYISLLCSLTHTHTHTHIYIYILSIICRFWIF